jgi:hypothetical protein
MGKPGGDCLEDLWICGSIILKWILKDYNLKCAVELSGLGKGALVSSCGNDNESFSS